MVYLLWVEELLDLFVTIIFFQADLVILAFFQLHDQVSISIASVMDRFFVLVMTENSVVLFHRPLTKGFFLGGKGDVVLGVLGRLATGVARASISRSCLADRLRSRAALASSASWCISAFFAFALEAGERLGSRAALYSGKIMLARVSQRI